MTTTTTTMTKMLQATVVAAAVAGAGAGCGGGGVAGEGAPIAALVCPSEPVRAGDDFFLDGSQTGDASSFQTVTLQVGDDVRATVSDTFTAQGAGNALATLTVVDKAGNTASASCKIVVTAVPPAGGFDINGSFAMIAYDSPQLAGGILDPATQCAVAPQISLVKLALAGSNVTMTMKTCSITLPTVRVTGFDLQTTEVPPEFVAALPEIGPVTFPIEGAAFAPPIDAVGVPLVAGAVLDSPDAPLPNTTDGGAVGVPIVVDGWLSLNIVYRRTLRALTGTVVSNDEIDGSEAGSYQADFEGSLLNPLIDNLVPSGTGAPSRFKMTRVAADADCTSLRAQAPALLASLAAPAIPDACPSYDAAP